MTTTDAALQAVLGRVDAIERSIGDRFPLYAGPVDGRWTTTRRGSWTGGFWTGLLWLRAAVSGDTQDVRTAGEWTGRLLPRAQDDTDTRAMTFWYGAGVRQRWLTHPQTDAIAQSGAQALFACADLGRLVIPAGSAFGGGAAPRITVDTLAAVVALMDSNGHREVAAAHATAAADLLVHDGGLIRHHALLDGSGPDTVDSGLWARGQAWGLLGFAVAAERLGSTFTPIAAAIADRWLALAGHTVPPAVFGVPGAPPDTSAAVIAAAGLRTLGGLGEPAYQRAGEQLISAVVDGHLRRDGVLTGGCYDLADGIGCAHELIWGSYFLAAGLAAVSGRLSAPGW